MIVAINLKRGRKWRKATGHDDASRGLRKLFFMYLKSVYSTNITPVSSYNLYLEMSAAASNEENCPKMAEFQLLICTKLIVGHYP